MASVFSLEALSWSLDTPSPIIPRRKPKSGLPDWMTTTSLDVATFLEASFSGVFGATLAMLGAIGWVGVFGFRRCASAAGLLLAACLYWWPNGPCQMGRPEARRFWPGPGTARHGTKRAVPRHGPGSARAGLRFEARGPARHGPFRFFYFYLFLLPIFIFFLFLGHIYAKWAVPDGPTVPNGSSACLPGRAGGLAAARGPAQARF